MSDSINAFGTGTFSKKKNNNNNNNNASGIGYPLLLIDFVLVFLFI